MKKTGLFLLVAFLFVASCYTTVMATPIRVITYNLRYDNPQDSLDNWKYRRDFILSTIKFHKADILCIQEGLVHQVHFLADSLADFSWYGIGRDNGKEAGEFSAIFYKKNRFMRIDSGTFWLSAFPEKPTMGWDAACIRICTWLKLMDVSNGAIFLLTNTHFDHVGKVARIESAKLLRSRIAKLSADTLPVITCGDFNSSETDSAYTIMTTTLPIPQLYDTKNISLLPHHGPLNTYSGFHVKEGIIGERIDFIFVTKSIRVLQHATISDFKDDLRFPSDHLPVITEIEVPHTIIRT